jgi:hypothetical protein
MSEYNIVRDFNKTQGVTHPSDLTNQIRRDLNCRYVTVENSGQRPIGIGIANYYSGPLPKMRFVMQAGEIKHLGINPQGGADQFIYLLNPSTGEPVGDPYIFDRGANSFVLRDGVNKWWVQNFYHTPYRAAF